MSIESIRCPKCGGPIPAEAPHGLCPRCLLAQASIPTETEQGSIAKRSVPSQEEMAAAFPQLEILELIGQGGMGFVFSAAQSTYTRARGVKPDVTVSFGQPAIPLALGDAGVLGISLGFLG